MEKDNFLINWTFPELQVPERSKSWYIWVTLIGIILLFVAIVTTNFLFGLIIILIGIILFAYHYKDIEEVGFGITEEGLQIDDKFFSFKDIKYFWIIYEPPVVKNIYFELKSSVKPRITIPLKDMNPVKVRKILLEYLEEDLSKETEPLSESLGRRLKI